jgi:hypothetical protein
MWTTILQTPSAQNPFGNPPGGSPCWNLGDDTVAPFGPSGVDSCTVKPDTKIFGAWASWECSTFPPDHPEFGTTEDQLRACARQYDAQQAPSVKVDRHPVRVTAVETRLFDIVLPPHNILGEPAGHGASVAHGWITLLQPLTPGTHEIVIDSGTAPAITTTIIVKREH